VNKKYRKPLIAGNWKMNTLPSGVRPFLDELKTLIPRFRSCDVVICAPFTHLGTMTKLARESRVGTGAQDVSLYESGAYTGEVAAKMLADIDVRYVIVGHSERRLYHGESDFDVNAKVKAALGANLTPILCVGESLEQRERGLTLEYVAYQLKAALSGLGADQVKHCVLAYEPIWAIGTGKTATSEQAQEVCAYIRDLVRASCGARLARAVRILYGGSMNAANAAELLGMEDIDGGLIGGASLKAEEFAKIVLIAAEEEEREEAQEQEEIKN